MESNESVVRSFDTNKPTPIHEVAQGFSMPITVGIFVLAVVLGTGIGYFMAGGGTGGSSAGSVGKMIGGKEPAKTAGVQDEEKFPDQAEGTLKDGGFEGTGNFHLERPGGESQNVYLTSSIVDLSEYVGKKVRVNGQTFDSDKVGWLMDVGYVEIL